MGGGVLVLWNPYDTTLRRTRGRGQNARGAPPIPLFGPRHPQRCYHPATTEFPHPRSTPVTHDLAAVTAPCLTARTLARSRVRLTDTLDLPGVREPVIELPEGVSIEVCCLQFAALQRLLEADLIMGITPGEPLMIDITTKSYIQVYLEFFGGQECGDRQYADVTLDLHENWQGRARFLSAAQVLDMNRPGLRIRLLELADPEAWPEVEVHRQARIALLRTDPEHPSLQDV